MEGIMIKDAVKELKIEAHVLRYWEEELNLNIKRNSMGHRYYDDKDIRLFKEINNLRESGVSLKDIRLAIEKARKEFGADDNSKQNIYEEKTTDKSVETLEEKTAILNVTKAAIDEQLSENKNEIDENKIVDFKSVQLQNMMNKLVANALRENKKIITTSVKNEIADDVMKQIDLVIKEKEEREEERFRRLDENIRKLQQSEALIAATKAPKKRWWKKY
ncbi:MAG: MerR family transcriptional regulator [Lachnospiraceae bacterium]|nr:MerR family transcriptional regulator [Lachnospiraceae bacterium]